MMSPVLVVGRTLGGAAGATLSPGCSLASSRPAVEPALGAKALVLPLAS